MIYWYSVNHIPLNRKPVIRSKRTRKDSASRSIDTRKCRRRGAAVSNWKNGDKVGEVWDIGRVVLCKPIWYIKACLEAEAFWGITPDREERCGRWREGCREMGRGIDDEREKAMVQYMPCHMAFSWGYT